MVFDKFSSAVKWLAQWSTETLPGVVANVEGGVDNAGKNAAAAKADADAAKSDATAAKASAEVAKVAADNAALSQSSAVETARNAEAYVAAMAEIGKGPQGDIGPQGLQGPAGPQGAKGDAGPQGLAGLARSEWLPDHKYVPTGWILAEEMTFGVPPCNAFFLKISPDVNGNASIQISYRNLKFTLNANMFTATEQGTVLFQTPCGIDHYCQNSNDIEVLWGSMKYDGAYIGIAIHVTGMIETMFSNIVGLVKFGTI